MRYVKMGNKTYFILPVCFFLSFCRIFGANVTQNVQISVYYDSLSPKTQTLYDIYLAQTLEKYPENVTLKLFPNGNSTYVYNNKYEFTCPNGPMECRNNMIHTCAIRQNARNSFNDHNISIDEFEFLHCLVKHGESLTNSTIQNCAENHSIRAEDVLKCADGDEGVQAQTVVRSLTLSTQQKVQEKGLPLIIVNGVATSNLDEAQRLICKNLEPNADECSRATISTISYTMLVMVFLCTIFSRQ